METITYSINALVDACPVIANTSNEVSVMIDLWGLSSYRLLKSLIKLEAYDGVIEMEDNFLTRFILTLKREYKKDNISSTPINVNKDESVQSMYRDSDHSGSNLCREVEIIIPDDEIIDFDILFKDVDSKPDNTKVKGISNDLTSNSKGVTKSIPNQVYNGKQPSIKRAKGKVAYTFVEDGTHWYPDG